MMTTFTMTLFSQTPSVPITASGSLATSAPFADPAPTSEAAGSLAAVPSSVVRRVADAIIGALRMRAHDDREMAVAEDRRLVEASLGDDEEAFTTLVRRHERRVFRLVGRFYRRPEEVDDVAQEVFLKVWRKLGSWRGDAPFEHWLTRVCLNTCYQRLRRKRRDDAELDEALAATTAAPSHDPSARLEVARLLAALPATDRFILLLLDGEGWSTAEIAERLGWTRVNVKVRAHRARKKLRAALEPEVRS